MGTALGDFILFKPEFSRAAEAEGGLRAVFRSRNPRLPVSVRTQPGAHHLPTQRVGPTISIISGERTLQCAPDEARIKRAILPLTHTPFDANQIPAIKSRLSVSPVSRAHFSMWTRPLASGSTYSRPFSVGAF